MYQLFYELFHTYIYSAVELDSFQQLVCTEMASFASVAMVVAPLWLFWRILFR